MVPEQPIDQAITISIRRLVLQFYSPLIKVAHCCNHVKFFVMVPFLLLPCLETVEKSTVLPTNNFTLPKSLFLELNNSRVIICRNIYKHSISTNVPCQYRLVIHPVVPTRTCRLTHTDRNVSTVVIQGGLYVING